MFFRIFRVRSAGILETWKELKIRFNESITDKSA